MDDVITIKGKKDIIAMIFKKNIVVDGVKFFTSEYNPFQIGIHSRKKGITLSPHVHVLEKALTISTIQEVLFVTAGEIHVTLFETDGTPVDSVSLTEGDAILLMAGGHGVEFLKDSKIFEIKQGPYPGTTHAKLYLSHVK
jgi:uncharacterized protein YjlB